MNILSDLKKQLQQYDLRPTKRFSQNFLVRESALSRIVGALDLHGDECVVEIGAGTGLLTERLAGQCKHLITIEKDPKLIPLLTGQFADTPNMRIVHADIMDVDLAALIREAGYSAAKVVGNLPYHLTSKIIAKLIESDAAITSIVLTVQKEVAQRLTSPPGKKTYGALTCFTQYHTKPEYVATIPAAAFYPAPDVDSAVVRLAPRAEKAVTPQDEKLFFALIRATFNARRKTIVNVCDKMDACRDLEKYHIIRLITEIGIYPQRRGETFTLAEFAKLADALRICINRF